MSVYPAGGDGGNPLPGRRVHRLAHVPTGHRSAVANGDADGATRYNDTLQGTRPTGDGTCQSGTVRSGITLASDWLRDQIVVCIGRHWSDFIQIFIKLSFEFIVK